MVRSFLAVVRRAGLFTLPVGPVPSVEKMEPVTSAWVRPRVVGAGRRAQADVAGDSGRWNVGDRGGGQDGERGGRTQLHGLCRGGRPGEHGADEGHRQQGRAGDHDDGTPVSGSGGRQLRMVTTMGARAFG